MDGPDRSTEFSHHRTLSRHKLCDSSTKDLVVLDCDRYHGAYFLAREEVDVVRLAERRTGQLPTQVLFPGAARVFSPGVNFQYRLSYGVRKVPCAIACIYICAHVKDTVVHVRVRWIMKTLKHPACTVGWVARLCRSWLSLRKATRISHGRNPIGTIQLLKKSKSKSNSVPPPC